MANQYGERQSGSGTFESPSELMACVKLEGEETWLSQTEAIDAALRAAASLGRGDSVPTAYAVFTGENGTEAGTLHMLSLALLSDHTNIDFRRLADELDYSSAELLKNTEAAYELIDAEPEERERFENLRTAYKDLLFKEAPEPLSVAPESLTPVAKPTPKLKRKPTPPTEAPALDSAQRHIFQLARHGNAAARQAVLVQYEPIIDEVLERIELDVSIEDAVRIAQKVLLQLVGCADLDSPVGFDETLRQAVSNKLAVFQEVSEAASKINMKHYLQTLVEFEETANGETGAAETILESATVNAVVTGALTHIATWLDEARTNVQGLPLSNRPQISIGRRIERAYERSLREHIANSASMQQGDGLYNFNLTQLPTHKLATFLAESMSIFNQHRSFRKTTASLEQALLAAGYVPSV